MSETALGKPRRGSDPERLVQRQEQILAAAIELFAEHGYSDTDTQQLADKLRVGKGTIYRYFPSKRELFLAAADQVMRMMRERVDARMARIEDPLERITNGV